VEVLLVVVLLPALQALISSILPGYIGGSIQGEWLGYIIHVSKGAGRPHKARRRG
jgi:hypothetical protein